MLIPFCEITQKYNMKIHGILHIGAHNCEELQTYNNFGIKNSQIIWVEANPILVKKNLSIDNSIIIKNFICCDSDIGKTKLNIANNGQSSSILEFGTHSKNYPSIKYDNFIEVENCRIDTIYQKYNISKKFANFLNIDIQGAELLALKGMGVIINYFDYVYLEVNKDYVYKNCALVHEIDEYLSKYNFKRVETSWTNADWGEALYIKIKNNFELLENVRFTEQILNLSGKTLEEALEIAKLNPSVKALNWYKNNGGDGRIGGICGWYQCAGGNIDSVKNYDWDTILLSSSKQNVEEIIFNDTLKQELFLIPNNKNNGKKDLLNRIMKYINVIFDVGCGVNSDMVSFHGECHYFDPVKDFIDNLSSQKNKNKLSYFNAFGLGEEKKELLYYPKYKSFVNRNTSFNKNYDENKLSLILEKAEDYVVKNNIKSIDFLKINTRGFELSVLKSFGKYLQIVKLIQFEYGSSYLENGIKLREVIKYLESFGFTRFSYLVNNGTIKITNFDDNYKYCNIICINNNHFKSKTTNLRGRLCNQIIRNLALSIIAQKNNLYVEYSNFSKINDDLGIELFVGNNKFFKTVEINNKNYLEYYYFTNKINFNLDMMKHYFQTKEITNILHNKLKLCKNSIINKNPFNKRYNNNNDICLHVRLGDAKKHNPGIDYYKKCINKILDYDNIYLATDDFNHKIIKNLKEIYTKIIFIKKNPVNTIQFCSTCKYIILSHGSFSAIIGYLGFFSKVYYFNQKPKWCPLDMFLEKDFISV